MAANAQPKIYDSRKVNLILDGTTILELGPDDIVVSQTEDDYSMEEGIHADTTISISNTSMATLVFTLNSQSQSRPFVDSLIARKEFFSAWVVNDNEPREVVGGSKCLIRKPPDRTYGKTSPAREITVDIFNYTDQA